MPANCLYAGRVMHRRGFPVAYRFDYRVFSLLLDIDAIDAAAAECRLFSRNRFNLFSFHDRDHGPRDGGSLRAWAESVLQGAGIAAQDTRIHLLCMPRLLGYAFNPLSIWYIRDRDHRPIAVLCEVHNTFGEAHTYVLHRHGAALNWPVTGGHDKAFHVSPFIAMDAEYRFRVSEPAAQLRIAIHEHQHGRLLLAAVQTGERLPLGDRALLRLACVVPLMTFKVTAMIHWQALKLWLRRVPLHSKPAPPIEDYTS